MNRNVVSQNESIITTTSPRGNIEKQEGFYDSISVYLEKYLLTSVEITTSEAFIKDFIQFDEFMHAEFYRYQQKKYHDQKQKIITEEKRQEHDSELRAKMAAIHERFTSFVRVFY